MLDQVTQCKRKLKQIQLGNATHAQLCRFDFYRKEKTKMLVDILTRLQICKNEAIKL